MRNILMATRFIDKQYIALLLLCLQVATVPAAPAEDENKAATVDCDENGDCVGDVTNCHKICGCDRSAYVAVYYNETSKSCVVNFKDLMISEVNTYNNDEEEFDSNHVYTLEEKIDIEANRIFDTILVSVILFISCCAFCVVSACLYCCRMSYADYKLKKDVKALAIKLKRDLHIKKPAKKVTEPIQENCNVVCEDAGVFVV